MKTLPLPYPIQQARTQGHGIQSYITGDGTIDGRYLDPLLKDAGTLAPGTYDYVIPSTGNASVDVTLGFSTHTGTPPTATIFRTLIDGVTEKLDKTGASAAVAFGTFVNGIPQTQNISANGEQYIRLQIVVPAASSATVSVAEYAARSQPATVASSGGGAVTADTGAIVDLASLLAVINDVHHGADSTLNVRLVTDATPAPTQPILMQATDSTNGVNVMPPGDAAGRAIFHKLTDGTNTAAVKAASAAAAAGDPSLVAALSPNSPVPAGENHVGIVTGSQKTVGVEIARPADTNAYAVGDSVNTSVTVPTVIQFSNLARVNSGTGRIIKARLTTDQSACVAQFRLWLFNVSNPFLNNDNAAFLIKYADKASRIGYLDFPALSTETGSDCADAILDKQLFGFIADASGHLYGVLETKTAFTPNSGQKFFVSLTADQD